MDKDPFITHLLEIKIYAASDEEAAAKKIIKLLTDVPFAHKIGDIMAILKWCHTGEPGSLRFYAVDVPYTDKIVADHVRACMIDDIVANIPDEELQIQFLITKPLFIPVPVEHWIISKHIDLSILDH
jgi:hypothetical protein